MLCGLSRQTRNDGWCLLTVCCSLFYVYSDLVEGFPQMSCDVAEALCSTLGAILASVSPPGVSHLAPTKDWDVLVHSNTAVHLSTADGQWEQSDLHQVVCGWVMEITSLIHSHSDDRVKIGKFIFFMLAGILGHPLQPQPSWLTVDGDLPGCDISPPSLVEQCGDDHQVLEGGRSGL